MSIEFFLFVSTSFGRNSRNEKLWFWAKHRMGLKLLLMGHDVLQSMIVLRERGQILLITQLEHQYLSGQLAALWGNESFSTPEPLNAMVAAAGNHDNGWWEWDSHPTVNPITRLPYTFTELPVVEWVRMYMDGINRIAQCDSYEGLMVGMHGVGLRKNRYGTVPATDRRDGLTMKKEREAVRNFIVKGERLQRKFRDSIRKDRFYKEYSSRERIWSNYKLIQVWDRLSLYLCTKGASGGAKNGLLGPTPSKYGEEDVELHLQYGQESEIAMQPFPLKKTSARLSIRGRLIPNKQYVSDEEFRKEYYSAEDFDIVFNIRR